MPPSHGPQLKATTRQAGKLPRHLLGPLVQPFVGRRIGRLANAAVARGGRGEEGEELKLTGSIASKSDSSPSTLVSKT